MATGEALLRGMADLLDRDMPSVGVASAVTQALASGMASFVMTVAQGDPVLVNNLIPVLVRHFELELRGRCNDPVGAVVTPTGRPT